MVSQTGMKWLGHITLAWKFCQRHSCISLDDVSSIFTWYTFSFPNSYFWEQVFLSSVYMLKQVTGCDRIFISSILGCLMGPGAAGVPGLVTFCPSRPVYLPQGKYNFLDVPWCGNGREALILKIARSYLLKNIKPCFMRRCCFFSPTAPEILVCIVNVRRNQHYYKIYCSGRRIRYLRMIFWIILLIKLWKSH